MNRRWAFIVFGILTISCLTAQSLIEPFAPVTSGVVALGKAGVASARGHNALFMNPAGLSSIQERFTIPIQTSFYSSPAIGTNLFQNIFLNPPNPNISGPLGIFYSLLTQENGGEEASSGVSFVDHNLGIGFLVSQKAYSKTFSDPAQTSSIIDNTYAIIFGYSLPIDLQVTTLRLGGLIRGLYKTYREMLLSELFINSAGNPFNASVNSGFGLGIDVGLLSDFGPVQLGIALRDIGSIPFLSLKRSTLFNSFFPWTPLTATQVSSDSYAFPMVLAIGISYQFTFDIYQDSVGILFLIDFQIPFSPFPQNLTFNTFLSWIHAGVELKILDFMFLRGGYNQQHIIGGVGIRIPFIELNFAASTETISTAQVASDRIKMTAEVVIRI